MDKIYRVQLNSKGMPNFSTAVEVADRPSAVDLSSVYSTAYKSGYDKGYADAVQGIADELVKQGKHIEADRPQGEWIPCSERLPEENEVVLTQANFKDDIKMAVSSRVDYNYWTGWGTREVNVIAWMPLPQPFGEREGE